MVSPRTKASLLIMDIQDALRRGTKHYRVSDGALLTHVTEVLAALRDEGKINLVFVEEQEPDLDYLKSFVAKS